MGVEPTCVQLTFHLIRSQRVYTRVLCEVLVGRFSAEVPRSLSALTGYLIRVIMAGFVTC